MVLLRFAPSPTGPLHLGGLRMALYNYLYAKKHGGKWILRIEDTDATRTVPGSVDGIRYALEWAGLEYDYGPGKDGPHKPYFQSERRDLYRFYADRLLQKGHAYRCFCTPDELSAIKTRLARSGSNATYDKRCLHLSDEEVARRVRAGDKFVVRVNDSLPPHRPPTHDLVFGSVRDAHQSLATDPVLLKSDLFPTYHLASVVDDYEMSVTHVLRGEEWLVSLPLHLDLYAHLNLPAPHFAHIPILLNQDRTKMSKRNGDVGVVDYIRRGWEPEAVINWLALAGWGVTFESSSSSSSSSTPNSSTPPHKPKPNHPPAHPHAHEAPSSTHPMSLTEMIAGFDLSALTQRASVLDVGKLEYLNRVWVGRIANEPRFEQPEHEHGHEHEHERGGGKERLAKKVHGFVKEKFSDSSYTSVERIGEVIGVLDGRLTNIQDIPTIAPYFFVEPDLDSNEAMGVVEGVGDGEIAEILTEFSNIMSNTETEMGAFPPEGVLGSLVDALRMKMQVGNEKNGRVHRGEVMRVVRWALTGMKDGPGIVDIMRVIGRERTVERVRRALGYVNSEVEGGG